MLLFPKPTKQKKARKRLKRAGEKTNTWEIIRKALVARFAAVGITRCELQWHNCFESNFLSFAHRKKRRYITDQTELETVALLCQSCHQLVEYRKDMFEIIDNIITKRKVIV